MGYSIYIAEDDKKIRELIYRFLESDGYAVISFENGDELLTAFRKNPADLVILDIMMPGTDGLEICSRLREFTDVPIILLTAKDSELDYVSGITQGSDDYLTKPFRPTILLMRVKALLRRVEMSKNKISEEKNITAGDLRFVPEENTVYCNDKTICFSQTELKMLTFMMNRAEKAYSREELLNEIWGYESEVETRVTDETIRRIRKKLLQAGSSVKIETIWGFGYRMKTAEETGNEKY